MKTTIKILLLSAFIFLSCEENPDTDTETNCSVEDPVKELDWLVAAVEEMEQSSMREYLYVAMATYEHKTVFIFGNSCPYCNTFLAVYDCSGNRIGTVSNEIDSDVLNHAKLIWP